MKKRIISLLLALVMLFGVLPVTALAESDAVLVEDPGTKKVEVVDNKQEEDKEEETPAPVEKSDEDDLDNNNGEENTKLPTDENGSNIDLHAGYYYPPYQEWRTVQWNQFYGFNGNGTGSGMSSRADSTQSKFTIYLGTGGNAVKWEHGTAYTRTQLSNSGIKIVPYAGYYVKQVLIGCNDWSGYNCNTAKNDRIARLVAQSTESATVTIDGYKLEDGAYIDGKPVWHSGAGYPSYIMIWIAKTPNPVKVIYDDGERNITGALISYDSTNDTLGNTASSWDNLNTITYTAAGEGAVITGAKHKVNDILDSNKTVTEGGVTYTFTGWRVMVQSEHNENQWENMSPATIYDNADIASGKTLDLNRNYKLVAQWKVAPTPQNAEITIQKVFQNLPEGLIPGNFTIETDGTRFTEGANHEFTANLATDNYTITEKNYSVPGYSCSTTVTKSGDSTSATVTNGTFNIDVTAGTNQSYTLTNVYTRIPVKAVVKNVICAGETSTLEEAIQTEINKISGIIYPTRNAQTHLPETIKVDAGSDVTLLYAITVTGKNGAQFTVKEDWATTLVYPTGLNYDADNRTYSGTLSGATDDVSFTFYVTKTFQNVTSSFSNTLNNKVTLNSDKESEEKVPYTTKAKVTITKEFVNVTAPEGYEIKLHKDGAAADEFVTKTRSSNNTFTFVVDPGKYTVVETGCDVDDYTYTRKLTETGKTDEITDFTVAAGDEKSYTLTNTYTKNEEPLSVTSSKFTILEEPGDETIKAALAAENVKYPGLGKAYVAAKDEKTVTLAYAVDVTSNKATTVTVTEIPAAKYITNYQHVSCANVTKVENTNDVTVKFTKNGTVTLFYTVTYTFNNDGDNITAQNTAHVKWEGDHDDEKKSDEVTIKKAVSVNFSDLIKKKLYITGDYKFTGETFRAKMRYKAEPGFGTDAWYEFKAEFGKNTKSGAVKDFVIDSGVGDDGYDYIVSFPKAGEYVFYLFEENDGKSGVTYDKSIYSSL